MQGKVKWFSEQKGYGYIVAENGNEHYFNIRDVRGTNLPRNGDTVSFESSQGQKGLKASSVAIVAKSQENSSIRERDDRAICTNCGKKMVPRIITHKGEPSKSVCPFCGSTYKDFGWCFIATAVYGDYHAPEVIALRRFRDETLQPSILGRLFIALYYRLSPPVASLLHSKPVLANIAKKALDLLVRHRV